MDVREEGECCQYGAQRQWRQGDLRSNESGLTSRRCLGLERRRIMSRLVGAMLLLISCASLVRGAVVSTFDAGDEGWTIADLASGGPYVNVLGRYSVNWAGSGGDPGGYISRLDPSTNSFFFDAPAAFLGDKSAYIHGNLWFSLKTDRNSWSSDRVVVLVGHDSSGQTRGIVAAFQMPPPNTWTRYGIALEGVRFQYDNMQGQAVSAGDFAAIMASVSAIRICGEFSAATDETSCLDSVSLLTAGEGGATFARDTIITEANLAYEGQDVVVSGCTVTIYGPHSFHSLTVTNNGVVNHPAPSGPTTYSLNLTIAGDAQVDAGSMISGDGLGYPGATGPGAGGNSGDWGGGGGGYGGIGGNGNAGASGGSAYGSVTQPTDLGSGGGVGNGQPPAGAGGGSVRLIVGGTLTLNGSISACGARGWDAYFSGGGSGGSIWIATGSLVGSGSISVNGAAGGNRGDGGGGGGGGGRIALYYASNTFAGTTTALGGTGWNAAGAGTIYTKADSDTSGSVLIDNANAGGLTSLGTDWLPGPSVVCLTVRKAAVQLVTPMTFCSLGVGPNGQLTHPATQNVFQVTVQTDAAIDATSVITADGRGCGSGSGPGAGGNGGGWGGGGGGYGGDGGAGYPGIGWRGRLRLGHSTRRPRQRRRHWQRPAWRGRWRQHPTDCRRDAQRQRGPLGEWLGRPGCQLGGWRLGRQHLDHRRYNHRGRFDHRQRRGWHFPWRRGRRRADCHLLQHRSDGHRAYYRPRRGRVSIRRQRYRVPDLYRGRQRRLQRGRDRPALARRRLRQHDRRRKLQRRRRLQQRRQRRRDRPTLPGPKLRREPIAQAWPLFLRSSCGSGPGQPARTTQTPSPASRRRLRYRLISRHRSK